MSFRNPLVGGVTLVRSAIQSNPYTAGSVGWSINRDGTAEFNSGTFRGSLAVGTAPGQRFIVNNTTTGDPLDVYDASNHLVLSIDNTGSVNTFHYSGSTPVLETQYQSSIIAFLSLTDASEAVLQFFRSQGTATQAQYATFVFPNSGSAAPYSLTMYAQSDDLTKQPTAVGNERNLLGSLVQSDQVSTANLTHTAAYSLVCNASGQFNQAHGCTFTPRYAQVTQTEPSLGGASPIVTIVDRNAFTNTNFAGDCYSGAGHFSGTVTVTVTFWG